MPRGIYEKEPETTEQLKARFMSRVNTNGPEHPYTPELGQCWIWEGYTTKYGYGEISIRRKKFAAHRIAYELFKSVIPDSHRLIRHTCHNTSCVNPEHLASGNDKENAEDQRIANRLLKGEKNPMAKLTKEQAMQIISLLGTMSQRDIGNIFNITQTTVSSIARGINWSHLERTDSHVADYSRRYQDKKTKPFKSHSGIRGADNKRSKLTDDKVREILSLRKSMSQEDIARMYEVSATVISNICLNKSWTHIER